jgi:hypothetical protein
MIKKLSLLIVALMSVMAQAAVQSSISGPGTILENNFAALDVTLAATGAPTNIPDTSSPIYQTTIENYSCGFLGLSTCSGPLTTVVGYNPIVFGPEKINFVDLTFQSGDGQSFSDSFTGLSALSFDLSHSFLYNTPGTYSPSFSAVIQTTADYSISRTGVRYDTQLQYFYCNSFSLQTCSRYVTTQVFYQYLEPATNTFTYQVNLATSLVVTGVNGPGVIQAVPEPETYAMMLAGLGLVGAIARRRKAKQTA